jgi:uncharacterized protein YndB with AHSA1/START domain
MNSKTAGDISNRQIITTRVFDAPKETVFLAWTDPGLLAQWWGPKGFTDSFYEFDLRTGGNRKFTMNGPDVGNYPNESLFIEIKEPERIVLNHVSKPHFQLTASFEEVDKNKTKLVFRQLFNTVEKYKKAKVFAVDTNEENMDRLEAVLKNFESIQS